MKFLPRKEKFLGASRRAIPVPLPRGLGMSVESLATGMPFAKHCNALADCPRESAMSELRDFEITVSRIEADARQGRVDGVTVQSLMDSLSGRTWAAAQERFRVQRLCRRLDD